MDKDFFRTHLDSSLYPSLTDAERDKLATLSEALTLSVLSMVNVPMRLPTPGESVEVRTAASLVDFESTAEVKSAAMSIATMLSDLLVEKKISAALKVACVMPNGEQMAGRSSSGPFKVVTQLILNDGGY